VISAIQQISGEFRLTCSTTDPCVYFRRQQEEITYIANWVDDGLVCSNNPTTVNTILQHLKNHFEMRTMAADWFAGLKITRIREHRKILITQTDFITKILSKFQMQSCHPKTIPSDLSGRLHQLWHQPTKKKNCRCKLPPTKKPTVALCFWHPPLNHTLLSQPTKSLDSVTILDLPTGKESNESYRIYQEPEITVFVSVEAPVVQLQVLQMRTMLEMLKHEAQSLDMYFYSTKDPSPDAASDRKAQVSQRPNPSTLRPANQHEKLSG
jgi:hypothetical protein